MTQTPVRQPHAPDRTREVGPRDSSCNQGRSFGPLLGNSEPMRNLYHLIARVAPTDATVLLIGESGSGKELVAQSIHERSRRRRQAMIALNCGAVPENLIESELFGHEKGSFTGATHERRGVFERASGGMLFLDEITEMPVDLQVRLLRVLETHKLTRVGGEHEMDVDVRVIAATNREPAEAVAAGKLREDLLYRLSVFPIRVPLLRERGDDVELLANQFLWALNRAAGTRKTFSPVVLERFRAHDWPGNVRELKNLVHRAFIMADDRIELDNLSNPLGPAGAIAPAPQIRGNGNTNGNGNGLGHGHTPGHGNGHNPGHGHTPGHGNGQLHVAIGTPIRDVEKQLIFATLDHYQGNKKRTAVALGVSVKTLYNRLHSYAADGGDEGWIRPATVRA